MILIVGGTGFVGKNLTRAIVAKGLGARVVSRRPDVVFLDSFARGAESVTVESLMADPAAVLSGITAVVYLASTSTPGANLATPWREAGDTLDPLLRVMKAVVTHTDVPFVYLSSGGTVYGQAGANLISEDTPLNPISPYGLGKQMAETSVNFMARTAGLRATILRPANPIGRWQMSLSQGVVGALMRAAQTGAAFPMIGDGAAVRDYFSVEDLVDAILGAIQQPDAALGQTFNVGSGQGHSVREVHAMVQDATGQTIAIEQKPARSSDVDRVVLDISRIKKALGWAPTRDLDKSLKDIWRATKD